MSKKYILEALQNIKKVTIAWMAQRTQGLDTEFLANRIDRVGLNLFIALTLFADG